MKICKHPCLVRLVSALQVDQPNPKWILVMEYCHGGSIRQKLLEQFGYSIDPNWFVIARRYAAETLLGVDYLHRHNIVHRDMKPDNVVLSAKDHCKIADFGVARVLEPGQKSNEKVQFVTLQMSAAAPGSSSNIASQVMTKDGQVPSTCATNWVGTWIYTAPEVSDGHYDSSVDLYGWGVMLFELLTVIDPEPQTEPGKVMDFRPHFEHHLFESGAEENNPGAFALCVKATSNSPGDRGTASQLKADLFFKDIDWDLTLLDCSQSGDHLNVPSSPSSATHASTAGAAAPRFFF